MERITVAGAGVMGREIAYIAAMQTLNVTLVDVSEEQLNTAQLNVDMIIKKGLERNKITSEAAEKVRSNIDYSTDLPAGFSQADFVIEAVTEKIDIKRQVFKQMDLYCPADTILATNTSTMSPTELGSCTSRPHKVVAMHFFNPVHKMPLIEVVRGLETSEDTVKRTLHLASLLGKETVVIKEFPGFVTSRISALVGNEAFHMLQEGLGSPEDIDKAIKLGLNYPMGPFELGDLVGLDTRLNNLNYLHSTLGEKYRPAPLLVQYVKAGRLGRKSGRGVFDYTAELGGAKQR
ncbi:3-hydroxyacyl-CoA dehydrogenase [Jeotgalibacillus campisalis]|uniref:3-hydroxybutyryl-CoA dehydrogenase n=1 Tax=Jeotgalibacillus campisalis TaxID=220754 RepID=A0A0C2RAX6_9BACL|nr:3-hydroxyacyl-CoA dehydrogenase [Jeotgalibacillus campisalis]KIL47465.1 3-hydroxybutyryl-CoA dehydrogenase [Jeotgalibacillus campisalis]